MPVLLTGKAKFSLTPRAGASRSQCEFAGARHCCYGARDLRVVVVEDLQRGDRAERSRCQFITQLALDKGTRAIQLFWSHFENRLARNVLLESFVEGFRHRIISRL